MPSRPSISAAPRNAGTRNTRQVRTAYIRSGNHAGGADGACDTDEQAVVREACYAVGLNPQEFDL